MTSVLITGARGQLGTDLVAGRGRRAYRRGRSAPRESGHHRPGRGRGGADRLRAQGRRGRPMTSRGRAVVINAAAYTAVDAAEADPDAAYAVNAAGPTHLAQAAAQIGPRADPGLHRLRLSRRRHPALRDRRPDRPAERVRRVEAGRRAGRAGDVPGGARRPHGVGLGRDRVATSSRRWPSWSPPVRRSAWSTTSAARRPTPPIWPPGCSNWPPPTCPAGCCTLTNGGETTWFDFARAIFVELGADPERVQPTTTANFPRPAPRPAYSVLSSAAWTAAGLTPLRDWRAALTAAFVTSPAAFRPA